MFKAIWKLGIVDFDMIRDIRHRVLVESEGLCESEVFDENDQIAAHLLVTTESGEPIATARIYPAHHITRMGHIAVLPEFLNQGYDDFALRMMLYKAQSLSGELIQAFVRPAQKALYERLGFELATDSVPFAMYTLKRSDIDLSGHH